MNATGLLASRQTSSDNFADSGIDALLELEAAARLLDLEDWIVERLRHPESEESHALLVRRDNGQPMTVPVVHVEHTTALGKTCGKVALATGSSDSLLRCEAMKASWQSALLGLPFGGGATLVNCDPRSLSERELQRVAAEFTKLQRTHEHVSYLGVGMNECIAGWMRSAPRCFVSGAAESAGGIDQDKISAVAICEIIRHWCMHSGEKLRGQQIAIQGFEGVGRELAAMLYHSGALLVAVADVSGGVRDPLGLNAEALRAHAQREGVLLEYSDAEAVTNADVLQTPCDVLVLSDPTGMIGDATVAGVKARLIVEFAPGVVSAFAERELTAREIEVVPSLLASAGGPLSAYVEYVQQGAIRWSSSRTNAFVRRSIRHAYDEIAEGASRWSVTARHAAVALGVHRVAASLRARGF